VLYPENAPFLLDTRLVLFYLLAYVVAERKPGSFVKVKDDENFNRMNA